MTRKSARPRAFSARPGNSSRAAALPFERIDWENIRIFNAVAEAGSLRAAAARLQMSASAVSSRIRSLEAETGVVLFARQPNGVALTAEGRGVAEIASSMLRHARQLAHVSAKSQPGLGKTVRVGATEGTGAFWLIPRMIDLESDADDLTIDFVLKMDQPKVADLEVDLAVQLDRPDDPELLVTHLGWIHVVLFASQDYVASHGRPDSVNDIAGHRFIEFKAPQIPRVVLGTHLQHLDARRFVRLKVNTSSGQLMAAMYGAGVTALPSYSNILTHGLVHVAPDFRLTRDVWLVINPRSADQPHIRTVINWIKRSFDQKRFPWFGKAFMEPADVQRFLVERGIETMFSAYRDLPR